MSDGKTGLQLRSLLKKSGELELSLVEHPDARAGRRRSRGPGRGDADQSVRPRAADRPGRHVDRQGVRHEGLAGGHREGAGSRDEAMAARLDQSLPVGNEGAGVVIRTGSSDAAKALMGKTVAMIGGAMYAQYRTMKARDVMALPAGTTPADGASWFVNPLTALGMTETMRREGHKALVHTAAASNLGQMLNKICIKDGIGLVNIVRSKEQADILHKIGAKHVVDSTAPTLHGRSDQRAGGNRRHDRVRRHRRRQARRANPHLHGDRGQQDRQGIQPLRLERAQAGLYLRRPRYPSDRIEPGVRHGLGRRRLAAVAVPAEDRPGRTARDCASAWSPNSRRPLPAITPRWCRCRRRCSSPTSPSTTSAPPARNS